MGGSQVCIVDMHTRQPLQYMGKLKYISIVYVHWIKYTYTGKWFNKYILVMSLGPEEL
jgi:hypothetical protein